MNIDPFRKPDYYIVRSKLPVESGSHFMEFHVDTLAQAINLAAQFEGAEVTTVHDVKSKLVML